MSEDTATAEWDVRFEELRGQYELLHEDLQGMRLWNVRLETTLADLGRTLSRVEDAARNVHLAFIGHQAEMERQVLELDARLRKLEAEDGDGDVGG